MNRLSVFIFLIAFAVRFSSVVRHAPLPDNVYESTRVAISLAEHGTFADPFIIPTGPTAHVAPGFPLVLGLIFRVFGHGTQGEIAKSFVNCSVSSLQFAFLPWIASVLGLSKSVGIGAGFFGALIPLQRYAESASSWESSWAAFLLLLLTGFTRRQWRSGSFGMNESLEMGALWGIALLFAPALASVYAGWLFVGVWLFRSKRFFRASLVSVSFSALLLLPWAYRNNVQLGSWIWFRDDLGLELRVSNQDFATPRLKENLLNGSHEISHPHTSVAEAEQLRRLSEVEYNRRKLHEALGWIEDHRAHFAQLTAVRMVYFWFPWVGADWQRILLGLVTALALTGLFFTWRVDALSAKIVMVIWLVFPLVYYVIQFDRRYRHPVEWTLLLMGTFGIQALVSAMSTLLNHRRRV